MSYTPTTWVTGDIVTADKLNNLESGVLSVNGGGGGVEFITKTYNGATSTYSLDKTYNEISAMVEGGKLPVILYDNKSVGEINLVSTYYSDYEDETEIYVVQDTGGYEYTADSADGELTYTAGGSN